MREETIRINACSRLEGVLSDLDPHARALLEAYLDGLSIGEIAASLDQAEAGIRAELCILLAQAQARIGR
jgi:hypothetical protein